MGLEAGKRGEEEAGSFPANSLYPVGTHLPQVPQDEGAARTDRDPEAGQPHELWRGQARSTVAVGP